MKYKLVAYFEATQRFPDQVELPVYVTTIDFITPIFVTQIELEEITEEQSVGEDIEMETLYFEGPEAYRIGSQIYNENIELLPFPRIEMIRSKQYKGRFEVSYLSLSWDGRWCLVLKGNRVK